MELELEGVSNPDEQNGGQNPIDSPQFHEKGEIELPGLKEKFTVSDALASVQPKEPAPEVAKVPAADEKYEVEFADGKKVEMTAAQFEKFQNGTLTRDEIFPSDPKPAPHPLDAWAPVIAKLDALPEAQKRAIGKILQGQVEDAKEHIENVENAAERRGVSEESIDPEIADLRKQLKQQAKMLQQVLENSKSERALVQKAQQEASEKREYDALEAEWRKTVADSEGKIPDNDYIKAEAARIRNQHFSRGMDITFRTAANLAISRLRAAAEAAGIAGTPAKVPPQVMGAVVKPAAKPVPQGAPVINFGDRRSEEAYVNSMVEQVRRASQ